MLVVASIVVSLLLIGAYLAAGGSSYEPKKVQDPCNPRPWSNPQTLGQIANQFTTSALDGAACQLGVSREALARALATPEGRERFKQRYGITTRSWPGQSAPASSGRSTTPKKQAPSRR